MTTTILLGLMLAGLTTGLLLQSLAVWLGVEAEHEPRTYLMAALLGTAGAFLSIPLFMLLDYGRAFHLIGPFGGIGTACTAIFLWKAFLHGDPRMRWKVAIGFSLAVVVVVLIVLHIRPT